MRLLLVAHGYPPHSLGGAELCTRNLALGLLASGHDVCVFHRFADREKAEYVLEEGLAEGVRIIRVNNTFRDCDSFEKTYRNDTIDSCFASALRRERPDLVHVQHLTCLSTNLVEVARSENVPVVVTLHDYWLICQRGQFLKRDLTLCGGQEDGECVKCLRSQLGVPGRAPFLEPQPARRWTSSVAGAAPGTTIAARAQRLTADLFFSLQFGARARVRSRMEHVQELCRNVDLFISPSRFLRERFIEFGVPAEKIVFMDNGIAMGPVTPRRPAAGVRFGYMGTLIPSKGIHTLIAAFNGVEDEGATLHIHGPAVPYEGYPTYVEDLKGLIRSPRIFMEGPYEPGSASAVLGNLDVLIVPSIWYENSPLTIHEAFAAGVPVIASDLGGMKEFVHDGRNGLTFRPGDAAALRRVIERILRERDLVDRLRPTRDGLTSLGTSVAEHTARYEAVLAGRRRSGSQPPRSELPPATRK